MLVALVSVGASYLWRQARRETRSEIQLLPPTVSRFSTEFEHRQINRERVIFQVRAARSAVTADGRQELEDVRVVREPEAGTATDWIEGKSAVYDTKDQTVLFEGDVKITLRNDTWIQADRATADLEREVVWIPGEYRLERRSQRARGTGMEYRIRERRLFGLAATHLVMFREEGRTELTAGRLDYELSRGVLHLREEVKVRSDEQSLDAEQMLLLFDENNQPREMSALGAVRLVLSPELRLEGHWMRWRQPAEEMSEAVLDVTGLREADKLVVSAVLEEHYGESAGRLESERVRAFLEPAEGTTWMSRNYRELLADVDVLLQDFKGTVAEADHFRWVPPRDGREGRLRLFGEVHVERSPSEAIGRPAEALYASRLEWQLEEGFRPVNGRIFGPVRYRREDLRGGRQELASAGEVRIHYEAGLPRQVEVPETFTVVTESGDGRERGRAKADAGRLDFSTGRPERALGTGDVEWDWVEGEQSFTSVSNRLEGWIEDGALSRLIQEGAVLLTSRSEDETTRLRGETARFRFLERELEVSAAADDSAALEVVTGEERLSAEGPLVLYRWQAGELEIPGPVTGKAGRAGQQAVFQSGFLHLHQREESLVLSEGARLVQGEQLVEARRIRWRQGSSALTAEESVEFSSVDRSQGEPRPVRIRSERLYLEEDGRLARFVDDVVASFPVFVLEAPEVAVEFSEPGAGATERVLASGGVIVHEEQRTWRAGNVVYERATGRVIAGRRPEKYGFSEAC